MKAISVRVMTICHLKTEAHLAENITHIKYITRNVNGQNGWNVTNTFLGRRDRNQQDATNLMFIIKLPSQHVHTVHTARSPTPHNHRQHNQRRTPHAVVYGLDLLMMGIMMSETCCDNKHQISLSCWFLSLSSPYFHDARSQEPTIRIHSCQNLQRIFTIIFV